MSEDDIRMVEVDGNMYWMPKLEVNKLISEFVKDLKEMKEELGTNYFDSYIKKWEEKLK